MQTARGKRRLIWFIGSVVLLVLGVVIGLIFNSIPLGLLLAVLVSIGWIIAVESASNGNAGIHDEDRGIEL